MLVPARLRHAAGEAAWRGLEGRLESAGARLHIAAHVTRICVMNRGELDLSPWPSVSGGGVHAPSDVRPASP